jgi:apolipoprotein N-acyltransferase
MATRLGGIPQAVCCLIGLVGLAWAVLRTRHRHATDNKER